ncbi:MAG TPA: sugar transferase [Pyrinomonadaceae bacterium]|jgi:exopolysaccharide biosynthesis polyprenyl glycosylphosphotransferase
MTARHGQLSNFFLKVSDLSLVLVALGIAVVHYYAPSHNPGFAVDYLSNRIKVTNALLGFALLIIWHVSFGVQGLYLSHRLSTISEELKEIARAIGISSIALLAAAQIGRWPTINAHTVAAFAFVSFVLVGGMRLGLRLNLRRLRRRGHNTKSLLIVGGGARAQEFALRVRKRQDLGYKLIGYVESDLAYSQHALGGSCCLGTIEDLPRIVAGEVIDEVAIALPIKSQYSQIESTVALLAEQGIVVHLLSDFFPHRLARYQPAEFQGIPLVSLLSAPTLSWRTEFKRLLDLLIATVFLILLLPLLVLVALAIKLDSPGPVLFVQERMGFNKRRFRMFKFRTMQVDAEARMKEIEHLNEKQGPIFKIRNDPRITRVGRWLRKASLDELPQLINVLLGDMSVVGPRPLSIRDALLLEEAWQKRRFSVKPGLTCLWQVSGRSNLSFEEWMQLDLEYIDQWSLVLDCRILLRTIPAILFAKGAS